MTKAFGINNALVKPLFTPFLKPFAQKFADDVFSLDQQIADSSLQKASAHFCQKYTAGVVSKGIEYLPSEGPLLILSNHPGICDTVALFSSIYRNDLKVLALDRPFLRVLPHLSEKLFLLSEESSQRANALRYSARYMQLGGCILTFPAGKIEPDPKLRSGALESVSNWSKSLDIFTRLIPDLHIVVAMVAGVFSPHALTHPLVRLRRSTDSKELFAAALQIARKKYQSNTIEIAFSKPISVSADNNYRLDDLIIVRAKEALESLDAYL